MRTIRRRPAESHLRWNSWGRDTQYRVTVRNEDTGAKRVIYEGFRRECRLPTDLRLTPDQLSFRIDARPAEDDGQPYVNSQPFTVIPRIGDRFDAKDADVMARRKIEGALAYRFTVRDAATGQVLIDTYSARSRFLLPAGQLEGRVVDWIVRARLPSGLRRSRWARVTPEAVSAAKVRAQTLVDVPQGLRPQRQVSDRPVQPAGFKLTLPETPPHANAMVIAVPVVARPQLAKEATGDSVLAAQWFNGDGGGAVEQAATLLEAAGLLGWFFIDVEQGAILGIERTKALARRLVDAGHQIGIYVGAGDLIQSGASIPERLEAMKAVWVDIVDDADSRPLGVMLGAGQDRAAWGEALGAAGVVGIVTSRAAQSDLASWAAWRTSPFAARADLMAFPVTTFLSTPAHSRDRVVRHILGNSDALAAGSAEQTLAAELRLSGTQRLVIAEIDALKLLHIRKVRDRLQARAWNLMIRRNLPVWLQAGWKRSVRKFYVAEGLSEIQKQLLGRMLSGLAESNPRLASWASLFDRDAVTGWLAPEPAFEGVLEHRRGPRRLRTSAIRRYDNTYRRALGSQS